MRFAVLASGDGSNLQALLDAEADARLAPAEIVLVLSDRLRAGALARARAAGKPTAIVLRRDYPDRDSFDRQLVAELRARAIDAVILAGFMRVLGPGAIDAFADRIINVHPSLLPAFPGLHAVRQALAQGVKVAGCTVHFVDRGVDTGPIIAQACVPVHPDDDEISLHARIKVEERKLLCQSAVMLARGALSRYGRVVRHRPDSDAIANPTRNPISD